jgi:hypothetical protein
VDSFVNEAQKRIDRLSFSAETYVENSFKHRYSSESSSGYCEGFGVDQSTTRIVNLRSTRAAKGIQA